ncbi:MAG: hypothetical protein QNJ70_28825 [Xenococcaceae cyanobacterium MO_207.B15]|nr:hypothetical protein [Xenococcaceae cyanobacterium MO_207.B15]
MMRQKSAFSLGNKVAIIDPDEITSEWAEFIIVYRLFNFYRLYSKSTGHRFWVKSSNICLVIQGLN